MSGLCFCPQSSGTANVIPESRVQVNIILYVRESSVYPHHTAGRQESQRTVMLRVRTLTAKLNHLLVTKPGNRNTRIPPQASQAPKAQATNCIVKISHTWLLHRFGDHLWVLGFEVLLLCFCFVPRIICYAIYQMS